MLAIVSFLSIDLCANSQTSDIFPLCDNNGCLTKPNDIAISSDDSFVLLVDSSTPGKKGISLRKYNFTSFGVLSDTEFIPLIQNGADAPLLNISLSQDNNKVLVYREVVKTENTLVQIVDLTNKSVKELMSVASGGVQIGKPEFIDAFGKTIIAFTINSDSPELVTIDTVNDQIVKKVTLKDKGQSVHVSSNLKQAVITYKDTLAQSLSIYDISSGNLSQLDINSSFAFLVDDFLNQVSFDLLGKKAVISSLGGSHVLHFLDLENNKLTTKILDKLEGLSLGALTPDGKTAVVVGSILDIPSGFKVYKTSISKDGTVTLLNSVLFSDGSVVLDVDITPDQSKIYILLLKDGTKQLLILNMKDLSKDKLLQISSDDTESLLHIAPNASYAVTTNANEASITLVKDLSLNPILKSILPNVAIINGETSFTINGFIDPLKYFFKDVKVCFRSSDFCATNVLVSKDGKKITGITPKFPSAGFEDVILTASTIDGIPRSSKYEGIFQFVKDLTNIADTFPPEITISAPKDQITLNSRRVLVIGKADGTGSTIKSVLVNGKSATLSSEGQKSQNVVSFVSDLQFSSGGTFDILVEAQDLANNSSKKSIKVTIDTVIPTLSASVESTGANTFKVTGTCNGTGSDVTSILVNSVPAQLTAGEQVSFSATTNKTPITITVVDKAGNKNELVITNALSNDKNPPIITVATPLNGQIIKGVSNILVSFAVTDDIGVKEVSLNSNLISPSSGSQYSQNLVLKAGENLISISATDTSDNKTNTSIKVTFIPSELSGAENVIPLVLPAEDIPKEKEVITLPQEITDLNSEIINQFNNLTENIGELVDIGSTVSVEISNPPPIPEGAPASIEVPQTVGLEIQPEEETPEIPKGFSFATEVVLKDSDVQVGADFTSAPQNAAILVDSTGRTFIVGFGLLVGAGFKPALEGRKYKFHTTDGNPLELTTTITIPGDAQEGDATVSILNKNQSLATVPLKIAPAKDVRIGKRVIAKPLIKEPIVAIIKNSGSKLILKIKGRNFIGRTPILIDQRLQRLTAKAKFFTNVTFVPSEGIKIKDFKVLGMKNLVLSLELNTDVKPGIKLFNVITPKGADIGAVVFPDPVVDGKLETTATPESLILEH